MTDTIEIPRHETALHITDDTTADDAIGFLTARLREPAIIGDVIVYNFNSHHLDTDALLAAVGDLAPGVYTVPYQVPGAWGFMCQVLPTTVADATLLTYRRAEGVYHPYDNWRTHRRADSVYAHQLARAFQEAYPAGVDR